ncbi:MAG: hypothetical protein M3I20_01325 [Mogibacterium diversum]|jgi:hypothetical protein|uniref:hypothetical protein n=1 Tax=Mogibacterium diversum TaxID=114527 RepID=UPI001CB61F26|nr:hypothetical protein [Mogibacterium diversum]MBF1322366.1 hypothetical protein [Mogibacterium diversum]MBF1341351.1 hypothetical protein [Mogibacterium diversum]UQF81665.1 MAG: hypothetical protein M3I20_01325 [Mogibacterium diversum]
MIKKILHTKTFKVAVFIFICVVIYLSPGFSWNVKSARIEAEKYIEQQYKFKPKYISGGYSSSLDASHYLLDFVDEKNDVSFEVEVKGGKRFFIKQVKQYAETDTYLEEMLIKKMREEISPTVKEEWGKKVEVEVVTGGSRTWETYQEPTLKNIENLYKKNYTIKIKVKKAGTKQEESEKLFEIVKFLRSNDYLPYDIDVDFEGSNIKGISIDNIDQINSANDILTLMN